MDPSGRKHRDRHRCHIWLLFVLRQIRQINWNISSSTHQRITTESFEILKFLSGIPETYEYFYSSKPPPEELNEKLKYATEMVSNYLEHVLLQEEYLPEEVRENWHSYVEEICKTAPIVRAHVKKYRTQYTEILLGIITDIEKEKNKSPRTEAGRPCRV
jgi:hypothetical protein